MPFGKMPVLQDNPYLNAAKQPISTEIKMADGVFIKTMRYYVASTPRASYLVCLLLR